jgi:hypothetical protein
MHLQIIISTKQFSMLKQLSIITAIFASSVFAAAQQSTAKKPVKGSVPLFAGDLSNASYPEGVWTFEDKAIWTNRQYENFELDLDFKTAAGTNSGVIVYCSDTADWIPNSIEIQIADDYAEQWAKSPRTWQSGAVFGRLAATKQKVVKKPGAWNHYTITCKGQQITVVLNGQKVTEMDMRQWTSGKTNPDGSAIPEWLYKPLSELPAKGHIGLQGKHAGAPVWFRNIRIREL